MNDPDDSRIVVMCDFPIELWNDENVPHEKFWEILREEATAIAAREHRPTRDAVNDKRTSIFRRIANPDEPQEQQFLVECDEGMAEIATLRLVVQTVPR